MYINFQTAELQSEGYLALDESKKIINVVSLERARLLKNRLAILTSRAEKVKTDFCHDVMVFSLLSLDGLSVRSSTYSFCKQRSLIIQL